MVVQVTKSTPGRRRSLLALAAARRRNKRRIARGLKPIVQGKQVSASSLSKHGGPGPHKSGSPQSVHGGDRPHWLDDVSLIRSQIRSRPELAGDVQDWSLARIRDLQAEEGATGPEIGEEIHALTTLYYEARNVKEVGQAVPEFDADIIAAEQEFYERYQVPIPPETAGEFAEFRELSVPSTVPGDHPRSILSPVVSQTSIADGMYGRYEPPIFSSELRRGDIMYHPRGPILIDDTQFGGDISGESELDYGQVRIYGHRSTGEEVVIDLAPDNPAPPYISRHILERIGGTRFLKIISKHGGPGPHANGSPQSIHGNWSRGTSSRQLFSTTSEQGGSTTRLSTGDVPTTGWAVAQKRYSQEITADQDPGAADIKRYIQTRYQALSQPGNYLGTWYDSDTGSLWLDVTQVIEDADAAYDWAKEQGEIAIFNLETFEEVTIDYEMSLSG